MKEFTEDRRAHARIDKLEERLLEFKIDLAKNTDMTIQVVSNTAELVLLQRGSKFIYQVLIWCGSIAAALAAISTFWKDILPFFKGH